MGMTQSNLFSASLRNLAVLGQTPSLIRGLLLCVAIGSAAMGDNSQAAPPTARTAQYDNADDDDEAGIDWQDQRAVDRFVSQQQPAPAPAPTPPRTSPPRSAQALGLTVGGAATTSLVSAPLASAPYMIGDFFGGSTSGTGSVITIFDRSIVGPPFGPASPVGPDPIVGLVTFPEINFGNVISMPTSVDTADVINQSFVGGANSFALREDPNLTAAVQENFNMGSVGNQEFIVQQTSSEAQRRSATDPPIVSTQSIFDLSSTYDVFEVIRVNIPNPGSGVVGRMKIAENGSPIPRDRVFFNYSYFDNVLTPGGTNVNRFSPGLRKHFSLKWPRSRCGFLCHHARQQHRRRRHHQHRPDRVWQHVDDVQGAASLERSLCFGRRLLRHGPHGRRRPRAHGCR